MKILINLGIKNRDILCRFDNDYSCNLEHLINLELLVPMIMPFMRDSKVPICL